MLIAQLSDLHIAASKDSVAGDNFERFDQTLSHIQNLGKRPDLYIITGDVAEHGDEQSYRTFLERMGSLQTRWTYTLGNHDDPVAFARAASRVSDDYRCDTPYLDLGNKAIICSQTNEAPHHGGRFDQARADDLRDMLSRAKDKRILLAIHHPPIAIGLEWLDPEPSAQWVEQLAAVIASQDNVAAILCGHVHTAASGNFCGAPVAICPPTAPRAHLDLSPLDPKCPDGRPLIVASQPGYALHRFADDGFVTLFGEVGSGGTLFRFDENLGLD